MTRPNFTQSRLKPKSLTDGMTDVERTGTLEQRYNRALICSQLKGLFNYTTDVRLYADQDKIFKAWEATSEDKNLRPRFFNVKDALGLDYDLMFLTSGYSSFWAHGMEFIVFTINFKGYTNYGLPMANKVVTLLGGASAVSRLICENGLNGLIQVLTDLHRVAKPVDQVKINNNIDVLNAMKGNMYERDTFKF